MGAYVYRLAAPSKVVQAALGDKLVTLGQVQYAYKPSRVDSKGNRKAHQQTVVLPCAVWKEREAPEFVATVHGEGGLADGTTVLRWTPHRIAVTDDPDWEGLIVGKLRCATDASGAPQYRIEPKATA